MLVYHAFADINHGVFRALLLHQNVYGDSIDFDFWRILDFIYLFPHEAKNIRVPRNIVARRNSIARTFNKYNDVHSPREFISRTTSIYSTIGAILGAKDLIDPKALKEGRLVWESKQMPKEVRNICLERAKEDEELLSFLKELNQHVPATGPNGIKARTNWMEHRYDA